MSPRWSPPRTPTWAPPITIATAPVSQPRPPLPIQDTLLPDHFHQIHHDGWMVMLAPHVDRLTFFGDPWKYSRRKTTFEAASILPNKWWQIAQKVDPSAPNEVELLAPYEARIVGHDGQVRESYLHQIGPVCFKILRVVPVPQDVQKRAKPKLKKCESP